MIVSHHQLSMYHISSAITLEHVQLVALRLQPISIWFNLCQYTLLGRSAHQMVMDPTIRTILIIVTFWRYVDLSYLAMSCSRTTPSLVDA